jgi:hypothetical protein
VTVLPPLDGLPLIVPALCVVASTVIRQVLLLVGLLAALRGTRDGYREHIFEAYAKAARPRRRGLRRVIGGRPAACSPVSDRTPTI